MPTPSKPIKLQTSAKAWEHYLQVTVRWIAGHREQSLTIAGTALVAVLFIVFAVHHRAAESDEAWTQLGNVQGALMQSQYATARKALDQWNTRYAGSDAATFAKFLNADLLYRTSDYAGAAQVYGDLAQTAHPAEQMQPLALSAQSAADEMAGRLPQALAEAKLFLEKHPDHFLSAPMMMSEARLLEMSHNAAEAAAVYDRFVILYPQSPWTALARSRQQALSASFPPPTSGLLPPH